jgi:hypothetical protein
MYSDALSFSPPPESSARYSYGNETPERERYATANKTPDMYSDAHSYSPPTPHVRSQLAVETTFDRRPIQIQRHIHVQKQHWFEQDESSLLSSYFASPENDTTLLLRPLLTTMLRNAITEFELQDHDDEYQDSRNNGSISDSRQHQQQQRPPLPWAALLLDTALPISQTQTQAVTATQFLQFVALTSRETALQQEDLLQSLWELLLLLSSSSIPPENHAREEETLPDMHETSSDSTSSSRLPTTTTTKQQALGRSSKEPRPSRVRKTRSVPRQTFLSSVSDYDADLGDSEFEELLQDMQLPTYATEEYEEYDQVMSDSDEEEEEVDEEMYEDYYDLHEEQDDAMFGLHQPLRHSQKWAVVDLGHAGREWQPPKLYLPRKGVLEYDIHYDSEDLEQDKVLDETDFELLRESNEIEWFDFETLDNILLGEDELHLLSDSDDLGSGDEDSEVGSILKSREVGLLGTSNAIEQDMDEASILFDGVDRVGIDENQYGPESVSSDNYDQGPSLVDVSDETEESGHTLIKEAKPMASLMQTGAENSDDYPEEPDWKIIQSFRKPFRRRLFRFWEWSIFRRLDQTEMAEGETATTAAGDYANVDTIDPIDAFPTKTNTLLDDLEEVEEEFDEMNLGDSAVDSCEHQYHQRPPPPLTRAPEYLASQRN